MVEVVKIEGKNIFVDAMSTILQQEFGENSIYSIIDSQRRLRRL